MVDARIRTDRGLGLVALVLGLASLVPVYGIAAAPFAVFTGLVGRRESRLAAAGLGVGLAGCFENALVLVFYVL